jgi:hypothetical protein
LCTEMYAKSGRNKKIQKLGKLQTHFTTEHRLYRKQTHTAQAIGYHAVNHAQRGLQDALLIEKSEALDMMATASATYWGTM